MKKISLFLTLSLFISLFGMSTVEATVLPIGGATYFLSGGGLSSTATSITLQSFTAPQTAHAILDSEISDTFYVTLEPGNRTRQEFVSCTTVTQNTGGTATLSGCTRGLTPFTPFTTSSSYTFAHPGGSQVIFSDAPQYFNQYAAKENNEAITGDWTVTTPVGGTSIANKNYVLSVVTGGSVSTNQVIVTGTAGETVSAGQVLYLNTADARWYKASASSTNATTNSLLSISQGAGTSGVTIAGGVLIRGTDSNQSGLTAGANYFMSATAGSMQTATTSKVLGKAQTTTSLYFDPQFLSLAPPIFFGIDAEATDSYRITPVNVYATTSSTYATGTVVYFQAKTVNTGTATLNLAGVGAKTIVKATSTTLTTGDIAAGQTVQVIFDGTFWDLMTPVVATSITKIGVDTHDISSTGAQTIPHGLGQIPRYVKITSIVLNPGNGTSYSWGAYDGTTQSAVWADIKDNNVADETNRNQTAIIDMETTGSAGASATIAVDATNITLTWSKVSTPTGTAVLLWEAVY